MVAAEERKVDFKAGAMGDREGGEDRSTKKATSMNQEENLRTSKKMHVCIYRYVMHIKLQHTTTI
jgi:hypothetical protein